MDRALRRHHATRVIQNRLRDHLNIRGREFLPPVHKFVKSHPMCCNCSKNLRGRPKVAKGMCHIGSPMRVIHWRQQVRELRRLVRTDWTDWEADEIEQLAHPDKGKE